MKILVTGFGSIGQRHLKNLAEYLSPFQDRRVPYSNTFLWELR